MHRLPDDDDDDDTIATMEPLQHPAPVKRLDSAISVSTPEQSPAPKSPTLDLNKVTLADGGAEPAEQAEAAAVPLEAYASHSPDVASTATAAAATTTITTTTTTTTAAAAELPTPQITVQEHTSEPSGTTSHTTHTTEAETGPSTASTSAESVSPLVDIPTPQAQTTAATPSQTPLEIPHAGGTSTPRSDRPLSHYQALPTERLPVPVEHLPPQAQDSSSTDIEPATPKPSAATPSADTAGNTASSDYDPDEALDREALAQAGRGAITVDDAASDLGYESDNRSSASTSLSSSVRDFAFENGRRYHKFREGRYNFPNDDLEQEREDMKHAMMKLLCQGKLHFAPIGSSPHEILDIGTGTGLWAMEMGDDLPSANVLGVDLSPIQPDWVPSNVRFMVDDVESAWLWQRNFFDYVHTRHVVQGIKDWPKLMRRTFEHLKPGGWMECQEIYHYPISSNGSMAEDHPIAQFWALVYQGLLVQGIDFLGNAAGSVLADRMREAGFVNITHRVLRVPLGTWPKNSVLKTTGNYWRHILLNGCNAIAMGPLTRGCGWTRAEVEAFLVDVRKAYWDNSPLMYFPLNIVYGQKPESAT